MSDVAELTPKATNAARPADAAPQAAGARVLYVFQGCFLHHTDGCQVRVQQTLDLLQRHGCRVTVYSYGNHPDWPWRASDEAAFAERYPGWTLVLEQDSAARKQTSRLRSLGQASGLWRKFALTGAVPRITPRLDTLRTAGAFDVLFLNNASGVSQINGLPGGKVIIDLHDFVAFEQLRTGRPANWKGLWALRKEVSLLSAADVVWCISYAEFTTVKELLEGKTVRFVPPTVNFEGRVDAPSNSLYDLLFIGSANRWNADALLVFLENYAKWRRRYRIAIAGKVCNDPRVRSRVSEIGGIELLGFQEDLRGLYGKASATLCPVEGTGTKIKLIESLAAGRPVFASPGAMRGLARGHEDCVLPLTEDAVAALFADDSSVAAARAAAARFTAANSADVLAKSVAPDLAAVS